VIARAFLIVCLLASLADAKPRKKKKPKAKAKPAATAPTPAPAPTPEPAPAVVSAPTPAPAPAPVARTGKSRVAVVGDQVITRPFVKALTGNVELVSTGEGSPVALATKHNLHAVIVVSATDGGGVAIVYQGSNGAELGRTEVKAAKFLVGKKLAPEVMAKLGDKVAKASAPAGGASVAAVDTAPSSSSSSTSGSASASTTGVTASASRPQRAQRTIVISVEERPFWRRLRYNDDIDERLRPSDLVANAVGIGGSWRPLQNLRNFSIVGRGELAVGVNGSRTSDGTAYSTSSSEWNLGVGFDVGIAGARVGVVATYGEQRFSLDDDAQMMELIPDVTYRFARGGLVVGVPLATRWDFNLTAGWRQLFGMGGMTEALWFPRAEGAGIDGSAGIAFHVTPWLNIEARVDLRRYFFAMNPEPGDPVIAGGATDQYLGGAIGLAVSPR
jgi:hypothetical protein